MFYSLEDLYAQFKLCNNNASKVQFLQKHKQFIEENYVIYVDNLIKLYS